MSVTIQSRSRRQTAPLTVTITDDEYGVILARCGTPEIARAQILNNAGRALDHRQQIADYLAQSITDEQRTQIDSLSRAYARQEAIYQRAIELGYGSYVTRAYQGGMMPESWSRIVERASESVEPVVTEFERERAMHDLHLMTESDREWSEKIARDTRSWRIERVPMALAA
jgi:hypothetical protein